MTNRPDFEMVRRGYDPETVDAHLDALETVLDELHAEAKEATIRANALQRRIEASGEAAISVESAFIAIADTKQAMLDDAQRRAATIIQEAEARAAEMSRQPQVTLDKAWTEAEAMVEGARSEVAQARQEAAKIIEGAHRKADVTVTDARHEALRLLAEAKSEAENVVRQAHADHDILMRKLRDLQQTIISMLDQGRKANPDVAAMLATPTRTTTEPQPPVTADPVPAAAEIPRVIELGAEPIT